MQDSYFMKVCCEEGQDYTRSTRLKSSQFKKFLTLRYGPAIADKLACMLDFSSSLELAGYKNQLLSIL